ncbi:MAG: hypothetical protein QXU64_03815 [Thermofilaceae archaeon]
MDLTSFIRLAAEWAEDILITPSDEAIRFLTVNKGWTVGVEYTLK